MKRQLLNTTRYYITLKVDGEDEHLPITIRKHPRARRVVIRYQPLKHVLSLTLPRYAGIRQGLRFVEEKRGWIEARLKEHGGKIPLVSGQVIPVLGQMLAITLEPGRGVTRIEGDTLKVYGSEAHTSRRVREFLKALLLAEIKGRAQAHAEKIKKPLGRITLRDTASRWGSCSHKGDLSFSWRLVFAPTSVLDYIVAHEVSHIKEHNHSDAFWSVVETICPNWRLHTNWLTDHGSALYKYR